MGRKPLDLTTMDGTLRRIYEEMEKQKFPAAELETAIGAPKGSFSNWKRGGGRLYYAYIDRIADTLGVSIDYLVRGVDVDKGSLSAVEAGLIRNFRKLSDREQKAILDTVDVLSERCSHAS